MNKKEKKEFYRKFYYSSISNNYYIDYADEQDYCDKCNNNIIKNEQLFFFMNNFIVEYLCFGCYMKKVIKRQIE